MRQAVQLLHEQAEARQVSIQTDVPDDLPRVMADPGSLEQVLVNLLDNAVKYTPEGGQITVAARRIPAAKDGTPAQQDGIELSVADTGIGIPEQDRPRVFERFYRVDKARSRELGGTGLGLAISRRIIEDHGGWIRAESPPQQGATFRIGLPVGVANRRDGGSA